MIQKVQGQAPFQVLASNFSIGPSNEGYTLQISADGSNYSDLFSVGANTTRMVTGVANGSYYRLKNNNSEVTINWRTQCNDGGSGGGSYVLPTASSDTLGGVKIGSGITIDSEGHISADGSAPDMSAYWTSAETKSYVDTEVSGATPDLSAYWTSAETQNAINESVSDNTILKAITAFPASAEVGDFVSKVDYEAYSNWGEEGDFYKWATLPISIYELPTERVYTIAKFTTANDDTIELKVSYDDGGVQWLWWYCSPYVNGVRDTSAQITLEPYNHTYGNIDLGNNNYAQINWNDTTLKLGVTDGTDGFLVATYTAIPNLVLSPIIKKTIMDGTYTYDGEEWVSVNDDIDTIDKVASEALVDLNDRLTEVEDNYVAGDGITNIVKLSQQEYEDLQNKDASTLYIIANNN